MPSRFGSPKLGDDHEEEPICYSCALKQITGDRVPEEGDFNSARIISGEMSEHEWRLLQEDLQAVEEGRSIREYDDPLWGDNYVDPAWCYTCNRDTAFCFCDYQDDDYDDYLSEDE